MKKSIDELYVEWILKGDCGCMHEQTKNAIRDITSLYAKYDFNRTAFDKAKEFALRLVNTNSNSLQAAESVLREYAQTLERNSLKRAILKDCADILLGYCYKAE